MILLTSTARLFQPSIAGFAKKFHGTSFLTAGLNNFRECTLKFLKGMDKRICIISPCQKFICLDQICNLSSLLQSGREFQCLGAMTEKALLPRDARTYGMDRTDKSDDLL